MTFTLFAVLTWCISMATVMAAELEDVLARRTESLDAAGISLLVRRSTEAVFGRTNVENTM